MSMAATQSASNITRTGAVTGLAIQPRTLKEQAEKLSLLSAEAVELAHDHLDRIAADTASTEEQFNAAAAEARRAEAAREEALYLVQLVAGMAPEEQNAKRELVAAVTR